MKRIGEHVADRLNHTQGIFTVERQIRAKWVCTKCKTADEPARRSLVSLTEWIEVGPVWESCNVRPMATRMATILVKKQNG